MFTGIVTDLGTVRRITPGPVTRLEIETAYPVGEIALGASVCCNGCCLSVVEKSPNWMAFEVSGEMIMIEGIWPGLPSRAPAPDASSPVVIFVYVPDVDATVARAVANGARVLVPVQDQFWGDRIAWFIDPAGHVWTVASRIEDTSVAERTARWDKILAEGQ